MALKSLRHIPAFKEMLLYQAGKCTPAGADCPACSARAYYNPITNKVYKALCLRESSFMMIYLLISPLLTPLESILNQLRPFRQFLLRPERGLFL